MTAAVTSGVTKVLRCPHCPAHLSLHLRLEPLCEPQAVDSPHLQDKIAYLAASKQAPGSIDSLYCPFCGGWVALYCAVEVP